MDGGSQQRVKILWRFLVHLIASRVYTAVKKQHFLSLCHFGKKLFGDDFHFWCEKRNHRLVVDCVVWLSGTQLSKLTWMSIYVFARSLFGHFALYLELIHSCNINGLGDFCLIILVYVFVFLYTICVDTAIDLYLIV